MWYIIVIIVAAIGLIFGVNSCIPQNSAKVGIDGDGENVDFPKDSITGQVSREQMKKLLQKLADSPPPEHLDRGAMCYDMAAPPNRAEYVCPKCGEKTLYTDMQATEVREIDYCRNGVTTIGGVSVVLDESQYCKHCSPNTEAPQLCIEVKYKGEDKPVRTCGIGPYDIQLLNEFTHGSKITEDDYGQQSPLKDYTDRLEQLLGVEVKHKTEIK